MNRPDSVLRLPSRRTVRVRRALAPEDVGRILGQGAIAETDLKTAKALGAWSDDIEDAADILDASEDPSSFGDG